MQREQGHSHRFRDWFAPQLEWVIDACRMTAIDTLGVALPPLRLDLHLVAGGETRVRSDELDRILFDVGDEPSVDDRCGGLNLVHALTREVGRLVVARRLPTGAVLDAPWGDALALHLATAAFLPGLIEGPGIEAGSGNHRGRTEHVDLVQSWATEPLAIDDSELARCLDSVTRASDACGGAPLLLRRLPQMKALHLGAPRIEQTLRRLGT